MTTPDGARVVTRDELRGTVQAALDDMAATVTEAINEGVRASNAAVVDYVRQAGHGDRPAGARRRPTARRWRRPSRTP